MRLLALLLLLSALLALPLGARASSDKVSKETLVSRGKKRTFYAFVPGSLKASGPVPLIILLHGSGRNGLSLVEKWKGLAGREGFVIAGPDASNSRGWRTPEDGPDFIRDLVEALVQKYAVNPRRVYLFGHSAGAVFALEIAALESEYFAAAAAHAGALESQYYSVFQYATRKTPIFLIVGTRDVLFPLPSVRATREALAERGFPVELRELWNHNHNYYVRSREVNRYAWEFLARHALGDEPKYKEYRR